MTHSHSARNKNSGWIEKARYFSFVLLCIYFILHQVNDYFGILPIPLVLRFLAYYFFGGTVVFAAGYFFFRDMYKAGFYTIIALCIFFFFGAYHDFIKSISFLRVFHSYTFNLLWVLILLVALLLFTKKIGSEKIRRLQSYIFTVMLILVSWESVMLCYNLLTGRARMNDLGDPHKTLSGNYVPCDTCSKPDIYFIIFDGFTSTSCLKEEFGYNNDQLDSFLSKKGFFLAGKSHSNYAMTTLSLGSTLNLNYLNKTVSMSPLNATKLLQGCATMYESELQRILEKEGYGVNNLSPFDLKGNGASKQYFDYIRSMMIHKQTLFGSIEGDILWNFASKNWFTGKDSKLTINARANHLHHFVTGNLDRLYASLAAKQHKPVFTYCHLMIPHEPFYLKRDGTYNELDSIIGGSAKMKSLYLEQLIYSTKLLEQLVDSIQSATNRKALIIIQGDHGFKDYETGDKKEKIFRNLNAFYFPDGDYRLLSDSISSVNTFRLVLNKYFHQQLPLLKDSSFYIKDMGLYFEYHKNGKGN